MADRGRGCGANRAAAGAMVTRQLVNNNYARLWFGQAVSQVGDFVFDTTLVVWGAPCCWPATGSHRTWWQGCSWGCRRPRCRSTPLAGVFLDRWDRPMSEYQYYEFLAVDRALNERQLAELRALSTRGADHSDELRQHLSV